MTDDRKLVREMMIEMGQTVGSSWISIWSTEYTNPPCITFKPTAQTQRQGTATS